MPMAMAMAMAMGIKKVMFLRIWVCVGCLSAGGPRNVLIKHTCHQHGHIMKRNCGRQQYSCYYMGTGYHMGLNIKRKIPM